MCCNTNLYKLRKSAEASLVEHHHHHHHHHHDWQYGQAEGGAEEDRAAKEGMLTYFSGYSCCLTVIFIF